MPAPSQRGYGLRVAIALGDTILAERMFAGRPTVTIGQSPRCTFVLPRRPGEGRRGRQVLVNRKGLHLLEGLAGRVHLGGERVDVETLRAGGHKTIPLGAEDWCVLHLSEQQAVRIVVQRIRPEPKPRYDRDRSARPLLMTTSISLVAFALLLAIARLRYDPDQPRPDGSDVSERMLKVMFSPPPDPPPEEEPQQALDRRKQEKKRQRAGGENGRFGAPDRQGPSNLPRNPTEVAANVGLVRELNQLADSSTMHDLLGVGGQVNQAMNGLDSGALVVGAGNLGMATRGAGGSAGGEGEGTIHGNGDVDLGGAGSDDRKRTLKGGKPPQEKQVSVQTGSPSVKGQLSKELIDREVRRHKAQITFCYNKQLLRFPDLAGKVVLRWIIAMDGSVLKADIASSSLGNKDAESCMVRALEGWSFPKPEGGVVQVDYPFLFGTK